jgi:tetratricopeptide (TPR) repeat protein
VDPVVYETTLRARDVLEHGTREPEFRKAIEMFQFAVDRDPSYAPAWAGLSYALFQLCVPGYELVPVGEVQGKAYAAAEKALALDPDLPEALWALGQLKLYGTNWDVAGGQRCYERALALRPGWAALHNDFAQLHLFWSHRPDLAEPHLHRARELDPFSPWNQINRAMYLRALGQHEQSLKEDRSQSQPNHWQLGYTFVAMERYAEATREFEAESIRSAPFLGYAALSYGLSGNREEARKLLTEMEAPSQKLPISPVMKAFAWMGLGNKDEAFRLLEKALDQRDPDLPVWTCPSFIPPPILKDPRWPGLEERTRRAAGLPEGAWTGGRR